MSNFFFMPPVVSIGEGALTAAAPQIADFGKKALVVTDPMMVKLGSVSKLTAVLEDAGVAFEVFDGVTGEPTDKMVAEGIRLYQRAGCDFLIALGGGSPIDTMKAIGAMITNPGEITDYLGKVIPNPPPPLVAIPTTAGTGSEATQFTIITDTERDIKMLLKGPGLIPGLAVVDPAFTLTSPPGVTAATGLDALTHAIEAYTSRKAQPMSDTFALSAVKRIFRNLPAAFHTGSDTAARCEMSMAALEAGIAFNNASVTIVHGMSRPIGALFHVPHGLSNAMLLPGCLKFALPGALERFTDLAQAIGVCESRQDSLKAGQAFIGAVESLCRELRIQTPEQFGIDRSAFFSSIDKMAEDALASGSPGNTLPPVGKEDVIQIYRSLWD